LEDFDNNLYVGLNWCLQPSSDVDALYETFSTSEDYFGRTEIIDLVPGGRDLDLTNDNKEYYVERKAYYHLYKSVQQQMDAFLGGFYEIIPRELARNERTRAIPDHPNRDQRLNETATGPHLLQLARSARVSK